MLHKRGVCAHCASLRPWQRRAVLRGSLNLLGPRLARDAARGHLDVQLVQLELELLSKKGMSVQWFVGQMVCRTNGVSDQWCLGLLCLPPVLTILICLKRERGFVRLHQFGPTSCWSDTLLTQHPASPTPCWSDNTIAQYFLYLNNT